MKASSASETVWVLQERRKLLLREEPNPTCLQLTYSNNTDPAKAPEPLEGLIKHHHQDTNELDLIAY